MVYLPKTNLVVRLNFGDESIALIQALHEQKEWQARFNLIKVIYIDTGWSAQSWPARVEKGMDFVKASGFEAIYLQSKATFAELVESRNQFPSIKFQWCAGFLKGLPLLEWLDEHDPLGEWVVALPKRQAIYANPLQEWQEDCEFHGYRTIWLPNMAVSNQEKDELLMRAGWQPLHHRSLECEPCIHSRKGDCQRMSLEDLEKVRTLEQKLALKMPLMLQSQASNSQTMSMGCGDPFGCGL
jgi:hypothetical protein